MNQVNSTVDASGTNKDPEVNDEGDETQPPAAGLGDDHAQDVEVPVEPTGLASDIVGGVRQLPARDGIKPAAVKRIIRHLTSGEPDGRTKAFSGTAVVLRYICDIMDINHDNVPVGSRGAKRILLDAIIDKAQTFIYFLRAHTNLWNIRLIRTKTLLSISRHISFSNLPRRRS